MDAEMNAYRCSIVRGGTSKGIFIMANELPADPAERDKVLLAIFGSPDIRQIDGLGGADVLTSKLAVISPCPTDEADVDYTFGQVSTTEPFIDYGGNCGNISSAVGGFAIDMGLVKPVEPVTEVRIRMTNTSRVLRAEVPVKNGKAAVEGDLHIDGVPGTGAKIKMDWTDAVGGITGSLLPTGNACDTYTVRGKDFTVSVVDAGNIVVFVPAEQFGLTGTETPQQIEADAELMDTVEELRGRICQSIGLVEKWEDARRITPYQPFFAMVSKAREHECFNGAHIEAGECDLVSRLIFMLHMHKAYPITGTVATGVAACIPGSVVAEVSGWKNAEQKVLHIAHPAGVIPVEVDSVEENGSVTITRVAIYRTARRIMDGTVYVKKSLLE